MSKNLTKTNNTIKQVIAKLCKCIAVFAALFFAMCVTNTNKAEAAVTVSSTHNVSWYSDGKYKINTGASYAYIVFESRAPWDWCQYSTTISGVTGKKQMQANDTGFPVPKCTANHYITVIFSTSYSEVKFTGDGDKWGQSWTIEVPMSKITSSHHMKFENSATSYTDYNTYYIIEGKAPDVSNLTITNSSGGNWTNGTVDISVSGATDTSAITGYDYSYTGTGDWKSDWSSNGKDGASGTWSAVRDDTVYFRACDKYGNCSSKSSKTTKVRIEKTSPTLTVDVPTDGSFASSTYYSQLNKSLKVTLKDNGSPASLSSTAAFEYVWCKSPTDSSKCSGGYTSKSRSSWSATIYTPNEKATWYLWIKKSSVKDAAGNPATTSNTCTTSNSAAFVYKFEVSNDIPSYRVELHGAIERNMNGANSLPNIKYYTTKGSSDSYLIIQFEGENLKKIEAGKCAAGITAANMVVSNNSDTSCKVKLTHSFDATYTIKIASSVIQNQSNIYNAQGEVTLIVDGTKPKFQFSISDTETGLTTCSSSNFCYSPSVKMIIDDNSLGESKSVKAQLVDSSSTVKIEKDGVNVNTTLNSNTTKSDVILTSDYNKTLGSYSLNTKYTVRVQNFSDLAGNYLCDSKKTYCDVISDLYISNVMPEVVIKYSRQGKGDSELSGELVPVAANNIKFSASNYPNIKVDAVIAIVRGNPSVLGAITNKSETYTNFVSTASGRTGSNELQFSKIAKSSGYSFAAEITVYAAWENASISTSTLKKTVTIVYDSFAPKFKDSVVSAGNSIQTSAQEYNTSTQKYDIYIDNTMNSTIYGTLMDTTFGYNSPSTSSPTFNKLKNLVKPYAETYTYKIDGKEVSGNEKVLKSVTNQQSSGEIEIVVSSDPQKITNKATVYFDCRKISVDLSMSNTLDPNNIYLEQVSGQYIYYYVGVGEFKLTITNIGSREIFEPVLSDGTTETTCESALTAGTTLSHIAASENHSCDVVIDSTYLGKKITIYLSNDYNMFAEVEFKLVNLSKSFDSFVTASKIPTFTINGVELKKDYISGSGTINVNSESSTLKYEMYLDYESFLSRTKTANMAIRLVSPTSTNWTKLNATHHLSSTAEIGTTITGQYYHETVTVSHRLLNSNMLGCSYNATASTDEEKVDCNSTGTLEYTLDIYYFRNNLEFTGPTSISVRNEYVDTLSSFAYKNADCNDETNFCENLKNGILPTGIVKTYSAMNIVVSSGSVTISKASGFIEGKYAINITLNIYNDIYKIQTIESRRTITMTEEIYFYTSDLLFTPVIRESVSMKWFDMIKDDTTGAYYVSITRTSARIYFDVVTTVAKITSVNMIPGKEITFVSNMGTYTSADPFGVDDSRVYIQLTSDMISAISDKTMFEIQIPAECFKINGLIQNSSYISFKFVNDITPAELPGTVQDTFIDSLSKSQLKVELSHKSYISGSEFEPVTLGTNEIYAVTYGDELKLKIAIKEESPLFVLHGNSAYNLCSSARMDLTSDKILLGNKEFSSCDVVKNNGYLVLTLLYNINKTWISEVKDISISSLIYDAAFNQIAYRSVNLGAVIKVLPNANIESVTKFEKEIKYQDPDTLEYTNYLNYTNTLIIKMAASDRTLFNYDKLTFEEETTTYRIVFSKGNDVKLTLSTPTTSIRFEADAANRRVLIHFAGSGSNNLEFDNISIYATNFFYDGAKMSTALEKAPLAINNRFVTNDIITLVGVHASEENIYMNSKSKETYSYINTYTGFNKEETYLYYVSGEDKIPVESVCDVTLNKTYANDIAYKISNCIGDVDLSNVGMHVKDKIDYEKDIPLNLNIIVDNTAPVIGNYSVSKDNVTYQSTTVFYILTVGEQYYAYYLVDISDTSSKFNIGTLCEVDIADNSKLLGTNPTCTILSDTTAKVIFNLDTYVTARSLKNEMSFDLIITDKSGNSAEKNIDAKISAVFDTSIAETVLNYRISKSATTCALNENTVYCDIGKELVLNAYFDEKIYSRFLSDDSVFYLSYEYKDADGKVQTDKIASTKFEIDADDILTITFNQINTINAPYATVVLTSELKDLSNQDMYVTFVKEDNNNIYLIGDVNELTKNTSPYYSIISNKATCVVQDSLCDVASQFIGLSNIQYLDKYGFEYNGIYDASTISVGKQAFTLTIKHTYVEPEKKTSITLEVEITKKIIYISFKQSSLTSVYSESFAPVIDRVYEKVSGKEFELEESDIQGKYILSLFKDNIYISEANVKYADVGIYDLIISSESSATDYQFQLVGFKEYAITPKKINVDLATVSDSLEIYTDSGKTNKLGSGNYIVKSYGSDFIGEKVYIVWKGALNNGLDVELISNYMVIDSAQMSVGVDKPIKLSSFSTDSLNYVVGTIPTYTANIGKIIPKEIELTLSSYIRKTNDGTNNVSYRGVDDSLEVKATYGSDNIKVTLPASNKIKFKEVDVGVIEVVPVSGTDTITGLFRLNTDNYILTKVFGEIVFDETPPSVEFTVNGHYKYDNYKYYASSTVTIDVLVHDESGLDFTKYGDIDIFTLIGEQRTYKNLAITQLASKYKITFSTDISGIYYVYVKDTLNEIAMPIELDINSTPITLSDEDLSVSRPEEHSVSINGSQFELKISVDSPIDEINTLELDINPKDSQGAVISDSIIGDYSCSFENNLYDNTSVITCIGKFKNNSIGYPTYNDGIRIFVNNYKIINYYGVSNFIGLSAKTDVNIKIDFHTVGINELTSVELYNGETKLSSTTNIYGKFDKLVATFTLSMALEDVEKPTSLINIQNDNFVIKNASNVCEISNDKMKIICVVENIKFDTNRIYNVRMSGEIKYTTNALEYAADVEYIADGSRIFEEGIVVDTRPLNATLTFISENEFRIEGNTAKYRVECNKDAVYVDCLNIDSTKVYVSNGTISINEDVIEWSGLKGIVAPKIKLLEGAIVDYAGNVSAETNLQTLNNSGITISKVEYTGVNGSVLTSSNKIGYGFTINVTIQFDKKVDLYSGIIYVNYKFGTGSVMTKEARFVTSATTSSVKFDIVVGENDSGQLFVTSVHNNDEGTVYDSSRFVAKNLVWTSGSGLIVDTDNAGVSGQPTIVLDSSLEAYKHDGLYYLNKTNINKASIKIEFTEPLKSASIIVGIDDSGGDTIKREFTNIAGKSVSIPLNNEYFKYDGRLQFSYVITMIDESGNVSVNEDLNSIQTNIILDRIAPSIMLQNEVLNVNINNLVAVEGIYTVNGGSYTLSEENVSYKSNSSSNIIIIPETNTIGYKFTYSGNPIVKTITIPAGIYVDFAGNNSSSVDVILNITEDSYTLVPYIYVNGTYKEAISYLEGTEFVYYIDKYTTFYFSSNVDLVSNTPKFQYLNGYYTYTPDDVVLGENNRLGISIPTETFYAEGMANSTRSFEYKLIDSTTVVSAAVTTSGDKSIITSGDRIIVTLTYTNPIIVSSAPAVRLSIGGSEIMIANHNALDSDTSLTYVYEYVVGKYDTGAVNLIGFDSPALDVLYNNVNINSNNNLGIVVDNAVFSATLELLEEGRTNSQAKFKVVCNKEENVSCYITDPNKVKVDGATVTIDNVSHIVTVSGLTSKKYEIIIEAGAVVDDAGKDSVATTYQLDNTKIYISNVKINKANDSNEYNNQFSTNSNFIVRATLTAGTKRLSVTGIPTITYKIGTVQYTNVAGEVSGNELIFIISPNSNDEGTFEIINMTTNAIDLEAFNNTTLFNASTDSAYIKKYDGIIVDTISPTLVSTKVIVNGVEANPSDGKYYLSALTLSKANLEVAFSEPLNTNSIVQVYISGYNSFVTSVANNVIGTKIIIPLNAIANLADGSFIIESISYTVMDLANNQVNDSSTDIKYVNASGTNIQIVYDNTAPEIIGISLVEGSKTTIKPGDSVTYELVVTDTNISSTTVRYTYTYDYTGNYNPIIPAGHVYDFAGNPSKVTKFEHIMIYVRDDKPFLQITDITYINEDANKVYYFGEAKPNVIKIETSDEKVITCNITPDGCGKYISFDGNGKLVINADIHEDTYGNKNEAVTTQYIFVDQSAAFTRSILDNEFNEENNVLFEGTYLVSNNLTAQPTYKLQFTSSREIKSVNYGDLRYVSSGNYYELTYRSDTFTSNTTVIITDYSNSSITLMSIVFDNDAPVIRFDQAEYTFNMDQNVVLNYNVDDLNAVRKTAVNCAINYGSCAADNTNKKITVTKPADNHNLYILTIPTGYYTDLVGNKSAEVVIRINIVSGPIFVPFVMNPLTNAYGIPVSTVEGNTLTYYVSALDATNVKFVTPNNGQSYTGALADGQITGYLLYNATWTSAGGVVTIPADKVTVGGINNIEQTFKFVIYDGSAGLEITSNLTSMSETVHINAKDTIDIIYTFNRDIIIVNGAPKLLVKIGEENVAFDDVTVAGRTITYKYRPTVGQNGPLTILGFEKYGVGKATIYDNAYNELNIEENDALIAYETKYIVDTNNIAEPTITMTHNSCIESINITNGTVTYYCDSGIGSTDKVIVTISNLEAGITNNLVMKINGVEYAAFNKNGVTEIPMEGREGSQKITITGKLIDTADNETTISHTINNVVGISGGYKVTMTLDAGNTIISQRTQMPKVTIKNNVGRYDKILQDLTNPDKFTLNCGNKLCSEIAGLGDIVITAVKSGNNVVLSLDGKIQDNFIGPNVAEFNFLTMESYYVIALNEFRFDNTTPTIVDTEITQGIAYNGKVYLINDKEESILEFVVDFNIPLYEDPTIYMGLDKNNSIDVTSYATITQNNGIYTVRISNEGLTYVHQSNKFNKSDNEIKISIGMTGENKVYTVETITAFSTFIDRSAPTVEFNGIEDNASHKIPVSSEYVNIQEALTFDSGVASVKYEVCSKIDETACVEVIEDDNYLDINHLDDGDMLLVVTVTDNVGNSKSYKTNLFIDRSAPEIYLEKLHYDTNTLSATIGVIDRVSGLNPELRYCVTNINEECTQELSYRVTLNESGFVSFEYNLKLDQNINYETFKITVLPVRDDIGNPSEKFVVTRVAHDKEFDGATDGKHNYLVATNVEKDYRAILVGNNKGVNSYDIVLDEHIVIMNVVDVPENVKVTFAANSNIINVQVSKDVKLADVMSMTVNARYVNEGDINSTKITLSYPITLTNIRVDTAPIVETDIETLFVTPVEGDTSSTIKSSTIISQEYRDERITSITPDVTTCQALRRPTDTCVITYTVVENSNWSYIVKKTINVSDSKVVTIDGASDDTYEINATNYTVVYAYGTLPSVEFKHATEDGIDYVFVSMSSEYNSIARTGDTYVLPLGKVHITYGYYTEENIMLLVTYDLLVVDLTITDAEIDSDVYYKEHRLDVSKLFEDNSAYGYVANYEVEIDGEVFKFTNKVRRDYTNVYFDGYVLVFANVYNGLYDITVRGYLNDATNTIVVAAELEDVKFDNGIYEGSEYNTDGFDSTLPEQSKSITITLTCDRVDMSGCNYYTTNVNSLGEVVEPTVENNVFTFVFTESVNGAYDYEFMDDAGNSVVITREVTNLDTYAPSFNNATYTGCININGYNYCNSPGVTVDAEDKVDPAHTGNTISGIEAYQFGYRYDTQTWLSNKTNNTSIIYENLALGNVYTLFVRVYDYAGNYADYDIIGNVRLANSTITFGIDTFNENTKEFPKPVVSSTITGDEATVIRIVSIEILINGVSYGDISGYPEGKISYRSIGVTQDILNAEIRFVVTDELGNVFTSDPYVTNVDITDPTVDIISYSDAFYYDEVKELYYISYNVVTGQEMSFMASEVIRTSSIVVDNVGSNLGKNISLTIKVYGANYSNAREQTLLITTNQVNVIVTVTDEAGNVSGEYVLTIIVDRDNPFVNNTMTIENSIDGTITYTEPFYTNYKNVYDIISNSTTTTFIITGYHVVAKLSMISDNTSGIKKVCLFNGDEVTSANIMTCQNSHYQHLTPSGNTSIYLISDGTYVIYAVDNAGNEFTHTYVINNVSKGIDFTVTRSSSEITGGNVTLTTVVDNDVNVGSYQIKWYKQDDQGEFIDLNNKSLSYVATVNGTYRVCLVSTYSVTKCTNDLNGDIVINNINTSDIVENGQYPVFDAERSVKTNNGYFGNPSGTGKLVYRLPAIISTLSEISVSGTYVKNNNNITIPLPNAVISADGMCAGRPGEYCYNAQTIRTYEIDIASLGLVNGDSITIEIVMNAANKAVGVYSQRMTFTYVDANNYTSASVLLSESSASQVALENGGYYKSVYAKLENVAITLDAVHVTKVELKTFDNTVISKDSYVLLTKNGYYNAISLVITDEFDNVKVFDNIAITSIFTIDNVQDDVYVSNNISNPPTSNDNKAYVKYTPYMKNSQQYIKIELIDNYHTKINVYADASKQMLIATVNAGSSYEFIYRAFYVEALDNAGNMSKLSNEIVHSTFEDLPFVNYTYELNQVADGKESTISLISNTTNINLDNYIILGYLVCEIVEGVPTCPDDIDGTDVVEGRFEFVKPSVVTDLSTLVGSYIKIYAKEVRGAEAVFYLHGELDLRNVTISAPQISEDSGIIYNESTYDEIIYNETQQRINLEANVKTIRYIVRDLISMHGSDYPNINSSEIFNNAWVATTGIGNFIARDTLTLDYNEDKGLFTSTLTLNYLDGEYEFYILASDTDDAGNVIYSAIKVLRVTVDTRAPKVYLAGVEIDESMIYNANVSGTPSITFTAVEERLTEPKLRYMVDRGSLSDARENPAIKVEEDGSHTITVCDLDLSGDCLNTRVYNVKVDASSPSVSMKYGETEITTSSTIGYTLKIGQRDIPTFETDIVIEDTSFDYVDVTVDAGSVGYRFRYDTVKGYLYRSGSRETAISIPVYDNFVNIVSPEGKLLEYGLHEVSELAETVTIDNINYQITRSGERIVSLTPITIYENSECRIPLRVLLTMALANNEFLIDVPYITGITLQAYDGMSQVNNSLTELTKDFDFLNPVISTVNGSKLFTITDNTIRKYLSDNAYRFVYTTSTEGKSVGKATSMLSVCDTNASNYMTVCDGIENVLHLHVEKDPKKASDTLLAVLQHILRFDGYDYNDSAFKNNRSRVLLYYTESMDEGQPHTEGLVDDAGNLVLTHLTQAGRYNFYIEYSDVNNNTSYYYVPIIVEDTTSPTFSSGTADVPKNIDIKKQADGGEYAVAGSEFTSLTYNDVYYGADGVTCEFVLTYVSSPSHTFSVQNCSENMQFEYDGMVYANYDAAARTMSFYYSGTYTVAFTIYDGGYSRNGITIPNTASKLFTYTVTDTTAPTITELVVDTSKGYTVANNTIHMGTFEYKDIKANGISLAKAIKKITISEPNQLYGTFNMSVFEYIASESSIRNVSSQLASNDENKLATALSNKDNFRPQRLGEYHLVYRVYNSNKKYYAELEFVVTIVNTEVPKFTITDSYLHAGEQVKDYLKDNEYTANIDITSVNSLSLVELASQRLNAISITVTDEFNGIIHDGGILTTDSNKTKCEAFDSGSSVGKYSAKYECTFTYTGTAAESLKVKVVVYLKDTINPTMATTDQTNYVNVKTLQVTLPACSDNADSIYADKSTCTRMYRVNSNSTYSTYGSKISLTFVEGTNKLEFYAIDRAGNTTPVYTYTYVYDKVAPKINLYAASEHQATDSQYELWCASAGSENCIANAPNYSYTLNSTITFVHFNVVDTNKNTVTLERYTGIAYMPIATNVQSNYIDGNGNIIAPGVYRLTAKDKANNTTTVEFYVYKEEVNENGNLTISVSQTVGGETTTTNIEYRGLYLIKYDSGKQSIPYSGNQAAFDSIKASDGVHIVGLNGDTFQYIRKYNGSDVYNLSTSIRLNDPAALENMIEINGETYLILLLVENDDGNGNVSNPNGGNNGGASNSGASFTWIFYVLGAVGVLGGGFLVMKLRKKVKAA